MQTIYENNFTKIQKILEKKKRLYGTLVIFGNDEDKLLIPHTHCNYSLSPWNDHYSSINHLNLYSIMTPKQLTDIPYVLVRDGLFTLIDFFNRFPTPKNFSSIFIVHKNLQNFIPEKWISKILFYDLEIFPSEFKIREESDELLVKGILMQDAFDLEIFKQTMNDVVKSKSIKKIIFCVPPRQNHYLNMVWTGDVDFRDTADVYMRYLHQELARHVDISFISWKDFFTMNDMHKYRFIDVNQKMHIYVDDHTDFFLLKKGARPFHLEKRPKVNSNDIVVGITPSHGLRIFAQSPKAGKNHCGEIRKTLDILGDIEGEKLSISGFKVLNEYRELLEPLRYFTV